MILFENLTRLKNFLQQESSQRTSNPIRFINVDSLSDYCELNRFLETLPTKNLFLSDYCVGADTFPNLRKLRNDLQKQTDSLRLAALSEFLRLSPECTIREIHNFINLKPVGVYFSRIYFLMYRMRKIFFSLKDAEPRQENCFLLLETEGPDNLSLTIIQNPLRITERGAGVGFKQYLQYWENPSLVSKTKTTLILYTDNARYLQEKIFFDDIKIIPDAFSLLQTYYDLPADFKKEFGDENQWLKLAERMRATGNFEKTFREEFHADLFSISAFQNFAALSDFQQWLLWLKSKVHGSDYLIRCADAAATVEQFSAKIYELIFTCVAATEFDNLCAQRKNLLAVMNILPPVHFPDLIRQVEKTAALKILTTNTDLERRLIFETLQRFSPSEMDTAQEILQRTFPALANYLSAAPDVLNAAQEEYFKQYRRLKVTNQITADFMQRVTEFANTKDQNLYSFEARNKIITEEYSGESALFFVDGFGVEYLNFILADFAALQEDFSIKYRIGRCNLPSVTELNKDFLQGRNVAADERTLDTLKHESRSYPENIISELEFLAELKEKIRRELRFYKKIILCSDHGTSRTAVLVRQTEFDSAFPADGRKVYKSGRFADAAPNDYKKYPNTLESDGKIIFADYSRFIQKGAPGNELHGGATLEEVLVPIITIEAKTKSISFF